MQHTTRQQIEELDIDPRRPLLISDVDEVVLHFTRDFEDFLGSKGLWLSTKSFELRGNISPLAGGGPLPDRENFRLIEDFFAERTEWMQPIDGAVDAVLSLAGTAQVVFLTNLPHTAGDMRRRNLQRHGLPFPVVTNAGPKGPAISRLAEKTRAPCVFVDDSPSYIASAREHAPHVSLVHFMQDERFARHISPYPWLSLYTATWAEARPHIAAIFTEAEAV
jgi:hypothetical protein